MPQVNVSGLSDLKASLKQFGINTEEAISTAIGATAFAVHETAVNDIRTQSNSGVKVKRGNKYHVVSKVGEAPNTDSGDLIKSMLVDYTKGDTVAYVGSNLDYAFYLETIYNRPFLEPAKQKEMGKFSDRITSAVKKQVDRANK